MAHRFKYVAGIPEGCGFTTAVVFLEAIPHQQMARSMFQEVTSAGFGTVKVGDNNEIVVEVFGESVGLNLKANPSRDVRLVERALGLPV